MSRLSGWLRSPRSLPLLLGLVVVLPAVTLVALGVRLLAQDRALAAQRRAEVAQAAADRAVRALEQELAAVTRRIGDAVWTIDAPAAGTVHVVIAGAGIRVEPPAAIAWHPAPPPLPEPPLRPFDAASVAEFQDEDFPRALALTRPLVPHPDPATRAGALLGQARLLRKLKRLDEAAASFDDLAAITGVAIAGVPADLVARQARCAIAQRQGDTRTLRDRAQSLRRDLEAGRWTLDRATYEFAVDRLEGWLGEEARRDGGREALAAAVEWLAKEEDGRPAAGSRSVASGGAAAVVTWSGAPGRVAAIVALPPFVDRAWKPAADRAAAPAVISLAAASAAPRAPRGEPLPASVAMAMAEECTVARPDVVATRPAADTGLPWTVIASVPAEADLDGLAARERTLLAGLAAVLILAAAGAFLVVRARRQEIALLRLQSDFVSAVSHEFRTPLTTLGQFNELLGEGDASRAEGDELSASTRRLYHQAQARATERLRRLVESLLDFGRMEAGRRPYTFQPVDAGALVRDTVDEFRAGLPGPGPDGRGFDVRCEIEAGDHPIQADADALSRALWNLLDNAVKYSGEQREVHVTVRRAQPVGAPSGPEVAIAVRDAGIGIPRREQARIFQKFVRGDGATSARIKGTGIGLAMAQHIVSAHGGHILVESEPGRGSTFTILLPADEQGPGTRRQALVP